MAFMSNALLPTYRLKARLTVPVVGVGVEFEGLGASSSFLHAVMANAMAARITRFLVFILKVFSC